MSAAFESLLLMDADPRGAAIARRARSTGAVNGVQVGGERTPAAEGLVSGAVASWLPMEESPYRGATFVLLCGEAAVQRRRLETLLRNATGPLTVTSTAIAPKEAIALASEWAASASPAFAPSSIEALSDTGAREPRGVIVHTVDGRPKRGPAAVGAFWGAAGYRVAFMEPRRWEELQVRFRTVPLAALHAAGAALANSGEDIGTLSPFLHLDPGASALLAHGETLATAPAGEALATALEELAQRLRTTADTLRHGQPAMSQLAADSARLIAALEHREERETLA